MACMWVHGYPMADTAESVGMSGVFAADRDIELFHGSREALPCQTPKSGRKKLDEGSLNTTWKLLSRYVSFGFRKESQQDVFESISVCKRVVKERQNSPQQTLVIRCRQTANSSTGGSVDSVSRCCARAQDSATWNRILQPAWLQIGPACG